jgi:hypothetical protein
MWNIGCCKALGTTPLLNRRSQALTLELLPSNTQCYRTIQISALPNVFAQRPIESLPCYVAALREVTWPEQAKPCGYEVAGAASHQPAAGRATDQLLHTHSSQCRTLYHHAASTVQLTHQKATMQPATLLLSRQLLHRVQPAALGQHSIKGPACAGLHHRHQLPLAGPPLPALPALPGHRHSQHQRQ